MKPEIKQQWIDNLRSGKYNQTREQLTYERPDGWVGYCCLGVLTDQYLRETGKKWSDDREGCIDSAYNKSTILPKEIAEWAGLSSSDPRVQLGELLWALSQLNDIKCFSFDTIADIIEDSNL